MEKSYASYVQNTFYTLLYNQYNSIVPQKQAPAAGNPFPGGSPYLPSYICRKRPGGFPPPGRFAVENDAAGKKFTLQ